MPTPVVSLPSRSPDRIICFDVGGQVHRTTVHTAEQIPMLATAMAERPRCQKFFFDRDGTFFGRLLNFHRPQTKLPRGLSLQELSSLQQEAAYFQCAALSLELQHLYGLKERVRSLKAAASPDALQLAAAYRAVAVVQMQQGLTEKALRKLLRAQALHADQQADHAFNLAWAAQQPQDTRAQAALVKSCAATGDTRAALQASAALAELRPTLRTYLNHATAAVSAGDLDMARAAFTEALKHGDPESAAQRPAQAACYRGLAEISLHAPGKAVGYLNTALELTPEDGELLAAKGAIHLRSGELEKAVRYYTEALQQFPDRAQWWQQLADVRVSQKDYEAAGLCYERFLSRQSEPPEVYLRCAKIFLAAKEDPEALRAAEKILSSAPKSCEVLCVLADVLFLLGRHRSAEQIYDGALTLEPNNRIALRGAAKVQRILLKPNEECETLEKLVALGHPDLEILTSLLKLLESQGLYTRAAEHCKNLLGQVNLPKNVLIFGNLTLGKNYLQMGWGYYSVALEAFKASVEYDPQCAEGHQGIARVYLRRYANYPAAESAARKAVALDCNNGYNHYLLGESLRKQRRFAAAKAAYQGAHNMSNKEALKIALSKCNFTNRITKNRLLAYSYKPI
jgi:tetratricopeptide (TPR) repeat protein